MKHKLYILCGVAFSGKSTLARQIVEHKKAVLVSQDKHWFEKEKELGLDWESDEDWEKVQEISKAEIRDILRKGHSVVYDDISLKYADRESLRQLAIECGAEVVLIYLDTPFHIREERRLNNLKTKERHDVPDSILEWGLEALEVPQESEGAYVFRPESNLTEWLRALP